MYLLTTKTYLTKPLILNASCIGVYSIEEYIPGPRNVVADALSRLDLHPVAPSNTLQELLNLDDKIEVPSDAFPLRFNTIDIARQQDKTIRDLLKKDSPGVTLQSFRGGGKHHDLVCKNDKILIPKVLQKRIVQWYHDILCHPGTTRTEATIRQHFYWNNLREDVIDICSKCPTCQINKKRNMDISQKKMLKQYLGIFYV